MNIKKISTALASFGDPRCYLHLFRLLHYYGYSHVRGRGQIQMGKESSMAPNVSIRNGKRIIVGRDCHIGERCYLWAGDFESCIKLGDYVSLAPEVFITSSDYRFIKGVPFRQQPKDERDVVIGNDVWLGARVVVTAGVTIGDGCIVGAGAVVTKDIAPGMIAAGVPARQIKERT